MAQSQSASLRIIFGADTSGLDGALRTSLKKLETTSKKMASQGRALSAGLTAPLLAIAGTSLRVAVGFESQMAKVQAVSGATAFEFERLKDQAKELGRTTVFTASQVAQLQLEFSKLGFTASQIDQVTESTLMLAQATGSDLASAAEVAGATLRGFGLEAEELPHVTDVMAAAFSSSALDLTKFRESMKFVAPVAKAAGIGIEETTAMLGALANSGVSGSRAGTAMRRIISELGGTGEDVATQIKKLAEEGLGLADAKDEVGRSAQTALLILSKGMKTVDGMTEALNNSDGAAKRMAATMNDTADGAIRRMQSSIEGAQIAVGSALAPTLIKIVDRISAAATAFNEMSDGAQGTIIAIATIAAGIGPTLLVVGALISAYGKLVIATEAWTIAQTKARAAAILNPYVALAAAAAAVAVGIYKATEASRAMERVQDRINDTSKRGLEAYAKEASKVNQLAREYQLFEGDMERRKIVLAELQRLAPATFKNLDAEKDGYNKVASAVANYNLQLKEQAITQAFGNELTSIMADILVLEAEMREATIKKAEAQKVINDGAKEYTTSIKSGAQMLTAEGAALAYATKNVIDLQKEHDALSAGAATMEDKVLRAREALNKLAAVDGTGTATGTGTSEDPVKKVKTLQDARNELQAALEEIRIDQLISPNEENRLKDTATAYQNAAKAAYELKQTRVAETFRDEANAALDSADAIKRKREAEGKLVDTGAQIRKTLADRKKAIEAELFLGASQEEQTLKLKDAYLEAAQAAFLASDPKLAAHFLMMAKSIKTVSDASRDAATATAQFFEQTSKQVVDAITNMLDASLNAIGGLIEASIAAEKPLTGVRDALIGIGADTLTTLGNIAIQVGKTAIGTGAAVEAIKKALATLNGVVAIVAGAALIALGAVVRGNLAKTASGGSGSIPALAQGGITTGPTLSLIGDNPSGKEAVIPFERMGEFLGKFGGGNDETNDVNVTGRIYGQDLLLVQERGTRNQKRYK